MDNAEGGRALDDHGPTGNSAGRQGFTAVVVVVHRRKVQDEKAESIK